jgi:hypothetical protein
MRVGVMATMLAFAATAAWGQGAAPPSLGDQLSAQYQVVKTGTDSSGTTITQPGTVLAIQKGGILGVQPTSAVVCPAKFEKGELKHPGAICSAMVRSVSRYFTVGEKVYVSKIDVNAEKAQLSLHLLDCDSCNGTQDPAYYKSELVFQFPKGYLIPGNVSKIEDTIAQVLTVQDQGDSSQGQDDQGGQGQGQGQDQQGGGQQGGDQQAQGQQQQQQQAPESIAEGQTIQQVVASWGQPQRIVKLGAKQIYIYQDAKITFINGKVSDVQ